MIIAQFMDVQTLEVNMRSKYLPLPIALLLDLLLYFPYLPPPPPPPPQIRGQNITVEIGLTELDLAFRFKVSRSTVSNIWSMWIPFFGKELQPLIFWPTQEQNNRNYPNCFKMFQNTIGIIDCTEGALEKPSLAKAQAQTYSSYKSKNTWKKLICVTPSGTISFVSKGYGGCASNRYITETCAVLEKVKPGDTLTLFGMGFFMYAKGMGGGG